MKYIIYKNNEVYNTIDADKPHPIWDTQQMGETGDDLIDQYVDFLNSSSGEDIYFNYQIEND